MAAGGIISVQVLNEFVTVTRRKMRFSYAAIAEAVSDIVTLCPDPRALTMATHEMGLRLAARFGFSFYDALIIAAALDAKCDTLLSEDMQHGMHVDRLTIRNPFA